MLRCRSGLHRREYGFPPRCTCWDTFGTNRGRQKGIELEERNATLKVSQLLSAYSANHPHLAILPRDFSFFRSSELAETDLECARNRKLKYVSVLKMGIYGWAKHVIGI